MSDQPSTPLCSTKCIDQVSVDSAGHIDTQLMCRHLPCRQLIYLPESAAKLLLSVMKCYIFYSILPLPFNTFHFLQQIETTHFDSSCSPYSHKDFFDHKHCPYLLRFQYIFKSRGNGSPTVQRDVFLFALLMTGLYCMMVCLLALVLLFDKLHHDTLTACKPYLCFYS